MRVMVSQTPKWRLQRASCVQLTVQNQKTLYLLSQTAEKSRYVWHFWQKNLEIHFLSINLSSNWVMLAAVFIKQNFFQVFFLCTPVCTGPLHLVSSSSDLKVSGLSVCPQHSVAPSQSRPRQRSENWPLQTSWRSCAGSWAWARWWWSARPSVGCTPSPSCTSTRTWCEPTSPWLPSAPTNSQQSSTRA